MTSIRRTQHHGHYEQRMKHERERAESFAREDLVKKINSDKLIVSNAYSDQRVVDKRRNRIMQKEAQERDLIGSIAKEAERRQQQAARVAQDESIAQSLASIRDATTRDEKLRQQIRETDPEIRALKQKLDAGYANRELQAQITQHEAEAQHRTLAKDETGRALADERAAWEDEALEQTKAGFQKMTMYRDDLEIQLAEEENRKVAAYEQFMKEKAMIDDIVQRIHDEDAAFAEAEVMKKHQTKGEQDAFYAMQADFRAYEARRREAEDTELKRQAAELEARAQGEKQAKAEALAATEALAAKMGADVAAQKAAMEELEEARLLLLEEEELARQRQDEKLDMDKKIRRRIEMQRDHDEAVYIKQQRRDIEIQEEQEFRQAMIDKFARDDRLEQMSAQRRRMKGLEHGRAVEQLIVERRQRLEFERAQAAEQRAYEAEMAEARRQVIEQERQKLLREHAIKLLGFLPKGVIRDAGDLTEMPEDFRSQYTAKSAPDDF